MTNQWVPVAEKPPEGEFVLIRFDDDTYEVASWRGDLGWWSNDNLDFNYGAADAHVTHWQRISPLVEGDALRAGGGRLIHRTWEAAVIKDELARVIYAALPNPGEEPWIGKAGDLTDVILDGHFNLVAVSEAVLKAVTPVEPSARLPPACCNPEDCQTSLQASEPDDNPTIEDMEDLQSDIARLEGEVEKEKAKVQGAYADGMRAADIMADRASQNQADEPSSPRRMEPQPKWEEAPTLDGTAWVGRYRYMRQTGPDEGEADVDIDIHCAPADMPNAEPVEIDQVWYWRPAVNRS